MNHTTIKSVRHDQRTKRRFPNRSCPHEKVLSLLILMAIAPMSMTGCGQQLMPTPNIYVGSESDCLDEVPEAYRSSTVELVYLTDRAPIKDDDRLTYGSERSPSLAYGIATISIGDDLAWPDLLRESRTSSRSRNLSLSCTDIRELGRLPATPVPLVRVDGVLQDDPASKPLAIAARDAFCELISERVSTSPDRKDAYILVHGFANNFEDAAFVMAGLWHFLGRKGVPIIYTWPAGGSYAYDRESGEFTVFHLKQFLRGIASCPSIENIHIIAHSRGTDVALTALRELNIEYKAAGKSGGAELKLRNVVLAAADLDVQVVQQRIVAERIPLMPERMTVYCSETDRAIGAAEWLFKSTRRLGELRPSDLTPAQRKNLTNAAKLDMIQACTTNNLVGHDYFHSNPAVSSDIIMMLRDNRNAGAESGRPLIEVFDDFYEIRDGYPAKAEAN